MVTYAQIAMVVLGTPAVLALVEDVFAAFRQALGDPPIEDDGSFVGPEAVNVAIRVDPSPLGDEHAQRLVFLFHGVVITTVDPHGMHTIGAVCGDRRPAASTPVDAELAPPRLVATSDEDAAAPVGCRFDLGADAGTATDAPVGFP
jgi:hypothetical protein